MKAKNRMFCKPHSNSAFSFVIFTCVFFTVFMSDISLWQGVITAKYFWFASTMSIVSIVLPFQLFRKSNIYLTDVFVVLLIIYICINYACFGGQPNIHWWLTLLMIPLYVGIRTTSDDERFVHKFFVVVLMIVLIQAVWGMLQLYGFVHSYHNLYKITGTLFNPGPYSGLVAMGAPLALSFSSDKTLPRWEQWLGTATLFAATLVLLVTMSRSACLAAIFGSALIMWKKFQYQNSVLLSFKFVTRKVFFLIIGLLAVALLTGIYFIKKDSADGRMLIWRASMENIKKRPLFGAGYGNFTVVYGDAQAAFFIKQKRTKSQIMIADSPDYAFNEYLQIAVELGLIGLLLFLFVVVSPFINLIFPHKKSRSVRYDLIVLRILLFTFLVFATFSYPFSVLPLSILFVFFLALSAPASGSISFTLHIVLKVIIVLICFYITAYGVYQILHRRTAYYEWSSFRTIINENNYDESVQKYKVLYSALRHEKHFLFEYGQYLSKIGQYIESNKIFEEYLCYGSDPMVFNCMGNNFKEMGEFNKAENMYVHAMKIVPNRHYPLYLLMKLYKDIGQTQKAKTMATSLLQKPVKVHSMAIREMREDARKIMITSEE